MLHWLLQTQNKNITNFKLIKTYILGSSVCVCVCVCVFCVHESNLLLRIFLKRQPTAECDLSLHPAKFRETSLLTREATYI